eukprot:TRINITY_DN9278_c0_g1_i1.p1 TRINITY_DN9278_c0_g1~~TRINITY_DN9278_c0_g1_i1.p1  ORF type:complete len:780 (+),score=262.49 TRINITY_DN9278_c0_g1_i1:106-2445(+)
MASAWTQQHENAGQPLTAHACVTHPTSVLENSAGRALSPVQHRSPEGAALAATTNPHRAPSGSSLLDPQPVGEDDDNVVVQHAPLRSTRLDALRLIDTPLLAAYLAGNGDRQVWFSLMVPEVLPSGGREAERLFAVTDAAVYKIPQTASDTGIFFSSRFPLVSLTQILVTEGTDGLQPKVQFNGLKVASGEQALFTLRFHSERKRKECLMVLCHLLPDLPVLRKRVLHGHLYDMPYVDEAVTGTQNPATTTEGTSPLNELPPCTPLEELRLRRSGKARRRFLHRDVSQCSPLLADAFEAAAAPPPPVSGIGNGDPLPHHSYQPPRGSAGLSPRYKDGSLRIFHNVASIRERSTAVEGHTQRELQQHRYRKHKTVKQREVIENKERAVAEAISAAHDSLHCPGVSEAEAEERERMARVQLRQGDPGPVPGLARSAGVPALEAELSRARRRHRAEARQEAELRAAERRELRARLEAARDAGRIRGAFPPHSAAREPGPHHVPSLSKSPQTQTPAALAGELRRIAVEVQTVSPGYHQQGDRLSVASPPARALTRVADDAEYGRCAAAVAAAQRAVEDCELRLAGAEPGDRVLMGAEAYRLWTAWTRGQADPETVRRLAALLRRRVDQETSVAGVARDSGRARSPKHCEVRLRALLRQVTGSAEVAESAAQPRLSPSPSRPPALSPRALERMQPQPTLHTMRAAVQEAGRAELRALRQSNRLGDTTRERLREEPATPRQLAAEEGARAADSVRWEPPLLSPAAAAAAAQPPRAQRSGTTSNSR